MRRSRIILCRGDGKLSVVSEETSSVYYDWPYDPVKFIAEGLHAVQQGMAKLVLYDGISLRALLMCQTSGSLDKWEIIGTDRKGYPHQRVQNILNNDWEN